MAAAINIAAYSDALVVLGTAGIVVPLVHRLGLSPVLGYLAAGAALGPLGLGTFVDEVPMLYWLTVVNAENVAGIADLGVVFLLFLIGLELSYERLMAMRRLVLGLGMLQVLLSCCAIAAVLAVAGLPTATALMLGALLALSSTAIVLEGLSRQGRLASVAGRASFAVLLAQDLAVVPILMFVSILGAKGEGPIYLTVATALLQAAAAVAIIILLGRVVLRPLFRLVAGTQSAELFVAAVLFVIVGTSVVAAVAGLSMALGAFVAGLLLAGTEFRKSIEATVEPFKGLLLGIFFFTVGMGIDVRELTRAPVALAVSVAGLVILKALILYVLARLYAIPRPAALEAALLLGPGGEFAFVGIGLASTLAVIERPAASFVLAVTSLSMALIPIIAVAARHIAARFEPQKPSDPSLSVMPEPQRQHAVVVGYGRVGKVVCEMLRHHDVAFTAVDSNAAAVRSDRTDGHPVYFGDATSAGFLKACGIMEASALVITIHSQSQIDEIVREARKLRPELTIISRARDAGHARHLYAAGVTDAVPETIEASLQLSEAALVGLGIPAGPVIASIHERRDVFRHELQGASRHAVREPARSLRSKRTTVSDD